MPPTVKTFKDFHMVKEKLKLFDSNIKKVRNYSDYEDLASIYLEGASKLDLEYEAARHIPSRERKLIIMNDSIAKQALYGTSLS